MIWCASKNGYQRDICSKDFGLRAQNMMTILGSIINIIIWGKGDLYDHFNEHKILDFDKE